jgi:ubiquitin C-terminal hydrolase
LNKLCLTESFKDLIENLWPSNFNYIKKEYVHQNSNNSYFAPYKFKEKISNMNDLFKGVQANDSKDLVNFIIMTLHEEMNKTPQKLKNDFMNINIDQRNKNLILYNFMKNFQDENKSIISDLFYAQNNNMTQCLSCKEIKYNFQTYFFIIFPLEEIRKFMNDNKKNKFIQTYNYLQNMNPMLFQLMLNNFMYNIQNQNYVTIYDCFNYNQKTDFFTGENSMYCNKCQKQNPASYTVKLYTGPQILIIILNRGVGIQYKVKLEFNQTLNLTPYIEKTSTGCFYNLIGVVTHMGESGATGHFIAYCKSPIDKQWYRYNDDLVSQVYNFKQEIIDYAMPYILFFQKIK